MKDVLEKQAVSPLDQMVFCPLSYREVPLERCLGCSRLVRADDNDPPRYIVCDARILDRREPSTSFGREDLVIDRPQTPRSAED